MIKLYEEKTEPAMELIGNVLVFCGGIYSIIVMVLAGIMPGSALWDMVLFMDAPWEAWKLWTAPGIFVFALGIILWSWDRG